MFGLFKKKEDGKPSPAQDVVEAVEPVPQPEACPAQAPAEEKKNFWQRLVGGLQKSTQEMGEGLSSIFTKKKLDDETLAQLEELLLRADLGPSAAHKLTEALRRSRFGKDVSEEEIRMALAEDIAAMLVPVQKPLIMEGAKPFVLLMVGVNGTGKTTTIGKLAAQLKAQGKKVVLVAGDTFRAAAVSQLQVWGTRAGCAVISGAEGADAASLAYKGLEEARQAGADVVLMDTAGRLHNKDALMAELQKIVRVIKKLDDTAPHATVLVLDATTGQNAVMQAEVFGQLAQVTGLVLTKLDGSARGGVLVGIAEKFRLPVHAIGVGEGIDDLQPFEALAFARALCGVGKATELEP